MVPGHRLRAAVCLLLGLALLRGAGANQPATIDDLLSECSQQCREATQDKAVATLEKLKALRPAFTLFQDGSFHICAAGSLGVRGKHEERVALVESFLPRVKVPEQRANLLYHLTDGYTALGKYERALDAMNESILLLPSLKDAREKIGILQGGIAFMTSLRAYDEAAQYAERMYALRDEPGGAPAACVGLTNKVEINFQGGNRELARSLVSDAVNECEASKNKLFSLIVKTDAAIDLIDASDYARGIEASLPLLKQFTIVSRDSDYVTQLEEALARAYLKTGNLARAEQFGLLAYQRARTARVLLLEEKASETMAAIKRAQRRFASAVSYYETNLELKKKILDQQLQKNLAYQRVKFEIQDRANQMALLEEKNKNLSVEKVLQQKKYQNLILLLTLGSVTLAMLGAWLFKTLRLKQHFRLSAQVDGLTQVSNRAHFMTCAGLVFMDITHTVSLVLFDMDSFKQINDTYGHAVGDWVLKHVCAVVKAELRSVEKAANVDLFGRLGGEEFVVCLPGFAEVETRALAQRCCAAIATIDTHPSGFDFPITASFGVATRHVNEPASFEDTLVQADRALYVSKNEGRNRVSVFQQSNA